MNLINKIAVVLLVVAFAHPAVAGEFEDTRAKAEQGDAAPTFTLGEPVDFDPFAGEKRPSLWQRIIEDGPVGGLVGGFLGAAAVVIAWGIGRVRRGKQTMAEKFEAALKMVQRKELVLDIGYKFMRLAIGAVALTLIYLWTGGLWHVGQPPKAPGVIWKVNKITGHATFCSAGGGCRSVSDAE